MGGVYISYFARLGDPAKGREWANRFYRTYREHIEELKKNPTKHGKCHVYPFDALDTDYRTFTCGWFTIFYTVEPDSFTVWHVRSSRSDFTTVEMR